MASTAAPVLQDVKSRVAAKLPFFKSDFASFKLWKPRPNLRVSMVRNSMFGYRFENEITEAEFIEYYCTVYLNFVRGAMLCTLLATTVLFLVWISEVWHRHPCGSTICPVHYGILFSGSLAVVTGICLFAVTALKGYRKHFVWAPTVLLVFAILIRVADTDVGSIVEGAEVHRFMYAAVLVIHGPVFLRLRYPQMMWVVAASAINVIVTTTRTHSNLNHVYGMEAGIFCIATFCSLFFVRYRERTKRFHFCHLVDLSEHEQNVTQLLERMMPAEVIPRLFKGENPADFYEDVTVLFAQIDGFAKKSGIFSDHEVVLLLNKLFSKFDSISSHFGVFKVETICEVYMIAAGIPTADLNHANQALEFGLAIKMACQRFTWPDGDPVTLKIGAHSGSVVAGVIGKKLPRYRLFGDTVNTASRMESTSNSDSGIQVSHVTRAKLSDEFTVEYRGEVSVKGKGNMQTYFVTGQKSIAKYRHILASSPSYSSIRTSFRDSGSKSSDNDGYSPFDSFNGIVRSPSMANGNGIGNGGGVGGPLQPYNRTFSNGVLNGGGSNRHMVINGGLQKQPSVAVPFKKLVKLDSSISFSPIQEETASLSEDQDESDETSVDGGAAETVAYLLENHVSDAIRKVGIPKFSRKTTKGEFLSRFGRVFSKAANETALNSVHLRKIGSAIFSMEAKEASSRLEIYQLASNACMNLLTMSFNSDIVEDDFLNDWNLTFQTKNTRNGVTLSVVFIAILSFSVFIAVPTFMENPSGAEDIRSDPNVLKNYWAAVGLWIVMLSLTFLSLAALWMGKFIHWFQYLLMLLVLTWTLVPTLVSSAIIMDNIESPTFMAVVIISIAVYFAGSGLHIRFRVFLIGFFPLATMGMLMLWWFDAVDLEAVLVMFCGVAGQLFVSYSVEIEARKDFKKRREIRRDQLQTLTIVQQLLPQHAIGRLLQAHEVSDTCDDVSLLFADLVGFTAMSSKITPQELVNFLSQLYTMFDEITDEFGVMKVETIGDCYWISSSLVDYNPDHADIMVQVGMKMIERLAEIKPPGPEGQGLNVRVGLHCGGVIAGVVGAKMPRYHLFGQNIQIAQLMEQNGGPGRINVSMAMAARLNPNLFDLEFRETLYTADFGQIPMFFVIPMQVAGPVPPTPMLVPPTPWLDPKDKKRFFSSAFDLEEGLSFNSPEKDEPEPETPVEDRLHRSFGISPEPISSEGRRGGAHSSAGSSLGSGSHVHHVRFESQGNGRFPSPLNSSRVMTSPFANLNAFNGRVISPFGSWGKSIGNGSNNRSNSLENPRVQHRAEVVLYSEDN